MCQASTAFKSSTHKNNKCPTVCNNINIQNATGENSIIENKDFKQICGSGSPGDGWSNIGGGTDDDDTDDDGTLFVHDRPQWKYLKL